MLHDALHVKHLRVQTAEPLVSPVGFAARLEDALRTASQPSAWRGRFVLVRRLSLRLSADAPAFALARQIETRWQQLVVSTSPYAASEATAVMFPDESSARLTLIERIALGEDVSAWYWQEILATAHRGTARPAARSRQIAALLAAPWTDTTLDAESSARYFADACRAIRAPGLLDDVIDGLDDDALQTLLPPAYIEFSDVTEGDDQMPASPRLMFAEGGFPPRQVTGAARLAAVARRFARAALDLPHGQVPRPDGSPAAQPEVVLRVPSRSSIPPSRGIDFEAGQLTRWAGLFFALNLFDKVERPPPSQASCVRWLRAIAALLRIDAEDPLYEVLDQLAPAVELIAEDPVPLRELRLICLRLTRRPLRRVLARGGRIVVSRTHLTIALRLAEVNLAVRKAGLDFDPGWLPALGRVVCFQYD
jgi:hypothetical protein